MDESSLSPSSRKAEGLSGTHDRKHAPGAFFSWSRLRICFPTSLPTLCSILTALMGIFWLLASTAQADEGCLDEKALRIDLSGIRSQLEVGFCFGNPEKYESASVFIVHNGTPLEYLLPDYSGALVLGEASQVETSIYVLLVFSFEDSTFKYAYELFLVDSPTAIARGKSNRKPTLSQLLAELNQKD